jgi:hypothetical protein
VITWAVSTVVLACFASVAWCGIASLFDNNTKPEVASRLHPFVKNYRMIFTTRLLTVLVLEGAWWLIRNDVNIVCCYAMLASNISRTGNAFLIAPYLAPISIADWNCAVSKRGPN